MTVTGTATATPGNNTVAGAATNADDETTAEFDSEQLARGWEALPSSDVPERQPRCYTDLFWAARTDIGRVRENNEDKFDFFLPADGPMLAWRGRLWAVADGMGGHNAGQVASEATLKSLIRSYYARTGEAARLESVAEAVKIALTEANALLHRAAQQFQGQNGMGTTVVATIIRDDELTVAHIGDSRAYLLRNGQLRTLTVDHSWVEEQVRRGGMTREQAEASPYRNIITRSVGMMEVVEADTHTERVQVGDTILLCSDGLSGLIGDDTIARLLHDRGPSEAALALVDAANDAGGRDNITALVLHVRSIA